MEYIPIVLLLVVVLVFITQGLKIITPYQRGVVERLGRYQRTAQPA